MHQTRNFRTRPGPYRRGAHGFTMIEIVAVLVVIGILIAVASERFTRNDGGEILAAADGLRSNLRYARARSMNGDEVWGVQVISATTYAVFRDGNTADRVQLPGQAATIITLPAGVTVTPTGIVAFDEWGRPCTDAGGVTLYTADAVVTVAYQGANDQIRVVRNTGYIP